MFISYQLRKKNIIEYLLYMWQIEELIRACKLDIDIINRQIVEPYQLAKEEKTQLYEWYENLIEMMRVENVQAKGHLQVNKNVIIQLNDFHIQLMQSGKDPDYNALYYSIQPALFQLRKKQTDMTISDIELCFNLLYGIMVLKLNKKEISPETADAQKEISRYLTQLNKNYQLYLKEELIFD